MLPEASAAPGARVHNGGEGPVRAAIDQGLAEGIIPELAVIELLGAAPHTAKQERPLVGQPRQIRRAHPHEDVGGAVAVIQHYMR